MCVVLGEGEAEPPPGFLLIAPLPCDASKHSQSMCGSMGIRGAKLSPVPLLYCPLNSSYLFTSDIRVGMGEENGVEKVSNAYSNNLLQPILGDSSV